MIWPTIGSAAALFEGQLTVVSMLVDGIVTVPEMLSMMQRHDAKTGRAEQDRNSETVRLSILVIPHRSFGVERRVDGHLKATEQAFCRMPTASGVAPF